MPSIRQLAQLAGVSPSTVSRALSGAPGVGDALRQRILDLARMHNFSPNRLAQGVLSGKTGVIGCLMPLILHPYPAAILTGILEETFERGYQVMTLESHGELDHSLRALETMIELRVDGVIIETGHGAMLPKSALLRLRSHEIPIVAIETTGIDGMVDRVCTDEDRLAEIIVDYLFSLGHRRIAYFGPVNVEFSMRDVAVGLALRRRGLETKWFYDVTFEHGLSNALEHIYALSQRPTAIIVQDDTTAAYVLQYLSRMGKQVPRDFSVIGCGNLPHAPLTMPPLTSVEQHPQEVGRLAVRQLLHRLEHASHDSSKTDTHKVMPEIIERQSCATPRS